MSFPIFTIKTLFCLAGGAVAVSVTALFALCVFAPRGWQDERGFHHGDEHADPGNWGV